MNDKGDASHAAEATLEAVLALAHSIDDTMPMDDKQAILQRTITACKAGLRQHGLTDVRVRSQLHLLMAKAQVTLCPLDSAPAARASLLDAATQQCNLAVQDALSGAGSGLPVLVTGEVVQVLQQAYRAAGDEQRTAIDQQGLEQSRRLDALIAYQRQRVDGAIDKLYAGQTIALCAGAFADETEQKAVLECALTTVREARRQFLFAYGFDEAGKAQAAESKIEASLHVMAARSPLMDKQPDAAMMVADPQELACPHCGSAHRPGAKFCPRCGAALDQPAVVQPAALASDCPRCGQPIKPATTFCGHCGQRLGAQPTQDAPPLAPTVVEPPHIPPSARPVSETAPAPTVAPTPAPAAARQDDELVLGVIPSVQRRKGLLGYQSLNVVVTSRRLVFALMTQQIMNDAIRQASADAQRQGKGLLGRMSAQMGWMKIVMERYRTMPIEAVLAEHADNFFIPLDEINHVDVKPVGFDEEDDEEGGVTSSLGNIATRKYHLEIESASGTHQFALAAAELPYSLHGGLSADDTLQLLREALSATEGMTR